MMREGGALERSRQYGIRRTIWTNYVLTEAGMRRVMIGWMVTMMLALGVVQTSNAAAKAPYCIEALKRCLSNCAQASPIWRYGCEAGCSIGYLFC